MAVNFYSEEIKIPKFDKLKVKSFISVLAEKYGKKTGEINYNFCSDERILEVNKRYLEHDYFTDIITFDYTEKNRIAGDIFISVDTVKSNAEEYDVDFNEELLRIIFHGVLHLCGINDKSEGERAKMTECENEALTSYSAYNKQ